MDWARNLFVRHAELYELVLRGMWKRGEEDASAIAGKLSEHGLEGCRILDIPCGIGRVGIPLAQLGFSVTGVDYSPHLLEVAARKAREMGVHSRTSFVVGEMNGFATRLKPDSFDCAINVFTSIGYNTERDDLNFFKQVRGVVKKGGLLMISGLRNRDYIVRHPVQNVYEETPDLLVLDRYEFDVADSREKGNWRFYLREGRSLRLAGEFPVDVRIYSPHEIVAMLGQAGWIVSGLYESLRGASAFSAESPVYSVVAE